MNDFIKEAFDCIAAANSVTTLTLGEMEKVVRDCYNEFLARSHDWQPIETAPKNKYVLVACKSGYVTIDWIYLTARYTEGWHDRWDDEAGDALTDGGYTPKFWRELPPIPQ